MAVASIAVDLAERNGCRILVIDWDLDAPGLHYYFGLSDEEPREPSGLVDYLENGADVLLDPGLEIDLSLDKHVPTGAYRSNDGRSYINLMTCGRRDDDFIGRVEAIDRISRKTAASRCWKSCAVVPSIDTTSS